MCEPAETESPANAALERIEADVRLVIEAGGEAALRARLERLLGGAGLARGEAYTEQKEERHA